jgi:hypothetical protein
MHTKEATSEQKLEREDGLHHGVSFAEYLAIPAVNHSTLRLFGRSAAHAREAMVHPKPPTEAQDLGQAIHTAVLEPDRFDAEYVLAPKVDRRTREGKAAWAKFEVENEGKGLLTPAHHGTCLGIESAVWGHPIARLLLQNSGKSEVVALWHDPNTGMRCKARLDRLTVYEGFTAIVELKSTTDAREFAFARDAAKFQYHSAAAFYLDGLNALAPMERRFFTIAAEKEAPYGCAVYEYGVTTMEQGRQDYRRFMEACKVAQENDLWPGYSTELQILEVPEWAIKAEDWTND